MWENKIRHRKGGIFKLSREVQGNLGRLQAVIAFLQAVCLPCQVNPHKWDEWHYLLIASTCWFCISFLNLSAVLWILLLEIISEESMFGIVLALQRAGELMGYHYLWAGVQMSWSSFQGSPQSGPFLPHSGRILAVRVLPKWCLLPLVAELYR